MTSEEVTELFRAHSIQLGCGNLDTSAIVQALQQLNRDTFDRLIMQAFAVLKTKGADHCLTLVKDSEGHLVVQ